MYKPSTAYEMGGYFSFCSFRDIPENWGDLQKFQSARAALECFLQQADHIENIYLPYFICDTVLSAVKAAKKEIYFYNIGEDFLPVSDINLKNGDVLYLVNYFGLLDKQITEYLDRENFRSVILDNAQALFSEVKHASIIATIYSPRKFFSLPDGGFLRTNLDIKMPGEQDCESINRVGHLVQRMSDPAEVGYNDYLMAEKSLVGVSPKKMSNFTKFLLTSVNILEVKNKRRKNYNFYSNGLNNCLSAEIDDTSVPLCFPYFARNSEVKGLLISNKIYIPTYWPEVTMRVEKSSFEKKLVDCLCALPLDQRYSRKHIRNVVSILESTPPS